MRGMTRGLEYVRDKGVRCRRRAERCDPSLFDALRQYLRFSESILTTHIPPSRPFFLVPTLSALAHQPKPLGVGSLPSY